MDTQALQGFAGRTRPISVHAHVRTCTRATSELLAERILGIASLDLLHDARRSSYNLVSRQDGLHSSCVLHPHWGGTKSTNGGV